MYRDKEKQRLYSRLYYAMNKETIRAGQRADYATYRAAGFKRDLVNGRRCWVLPVKTEIARATEIAETARADALNDPTGEKAGALLAKRLEERAKEGA